MAMFVSEADSHGKNAIYYNIRSFCCTIERLPVWDLGLFSNNNKKCKKRSYDWILVEKDLKDGKWCEET